MTVPHKKEFIKDPPTPLEIPISLGEFSARHSNRVFFGGVVTPWLVGSTPDQVAWVQALAGDIVLCSWARYFTLTVPLSTQIINGCRET